MKVHGVGVDIVSMHRIAASWQEHGLRFAKRFLNQDELAILDKRNNQISYIATRYAAKEAVAKAIGLGFREDIYFTNILISNDTHGKPVVTLLNQTKDYMSKLHGDFIIHLSLSDEKEFAVAYALVEVDDL